MLGFVGAGDGSESCVERRGGGKRVWGDPGDEHQEAYLGRYAHTRPS